jgi:hypothetical protein
MELSKILGIPGEYKRLKEREQNALEVRERLHDSRVGKLDTPGDKKPGNGKTEGDEVCLSKKVPVRQ